MRIMLRYYGWVTYVTNKHFEEVTAAHGSTVRSLIEELTKKYGTKIRDLVYINNQLAVTLNRQDINDKKLFPAGGETKLAPEDILSLIGPTSGAA